MSALEAVVAERLRKHMQTFGALTMEDEEFLSGACDEVVEGIAEMQPDHLINFDEDGWTIQHSMRCRVEGTLFDCPYTLIMARGHGSGGRRGLWKADLSEDGRRIGLTKA